jgi:aminopeptidase C
MEGKEVWKVRNSWGKGWGSQGHIYLEIQEEGEQLCGISENITFTPSVVERE